MDIQHPLKKHLSLAPALRRHECGRYQVWLPYAAEWGYCVLDVNCAYPAFLTYDATWCEPEEEA